MSNSVNCFGSKVFETEYKSKRDFKNKTIFYLEPTYKKFPQDYEKLNYFIDYLNILKDEYIIGHKLVFNKSYSRNSMVIGFFITSDPTYTNNNLDVPNSYLVKLVHNKFNYTTGSYDQKYEHILIDILNNKILYKSSNNALKYINLIFNNIFRN